MFKWLNFTALIPSFKKLQRPFSCPHGFGLMFMVEEKMLGRAWPVLSVGIWFEEWWKEGGRRIDRHSIERREVKLWMLQIVMSVSSYLKAPKSNWFFSQSFYFHFLILIFFFSYNVENRVSYERDTKIINAASFTIEREEHTIGNILRMYE